MISLHEIAKNIKLERDDEDKDKKVYKTDGGMWAGDYDGDIEYFDDEEKAKHWSQKGDMEFSDDGGDSKDDEDSAGKLGGSDFDRDSDDKGDEPKSEPKSEPKDTTGSIAGNEDAIDFAQALAQGNETNRSYQGLKDAGHEDLAKAIYNADSEEEKFDLVRKASEESDEPESKSDEPKSGSDKSDGEPTGSKEEIKKAKEELAQAQEYYDESKEELKMTQDPHDEERVRKYVAADFEELQRAKKKLAKLQGAKKESITINGKQYRPIKESKKFNKRVLKENYDRIFRSLK